MLDDKKELSALSRTNPYLNPYIDGPNKDLNHAIKNQSKKTVTIINGLTQSSQQSTETERQAIIIQLFSFATSLTPKVKNRDDCSLRSLIYSSNSVRHKAAPRLLCLSGSIVC